MKRLELRSYNMMLIEKKQKYQHYHQARLVNMNVLQAKNIPSGRIQTIQKAKFMYSVLGKAFGKQTKAIED